MSDFNIRPFDPNKKVKRVRRIDPPPPQPKDLAAWNNLRDLRRKVSDLRDWIERAAYYADNFGDPVTSRALLSIHRAMMRIEKRTFAPYVNLALDKNNAAKDKEHVS